MNPTKNDLNLELREQLCELMNARLADLIDLQTHSKHAHWNVKGPAFIALHKLFDALSAVVLDHIDELAERIVMLGGFADGTVQLVASKTTLPVYPARITSGQDHVDALSNSLAAFAKLVRAAADQSAEMGDADTADLFTGISRDIDKYLWFVESHLQTT